MRKEVIGLLLGSLIGSSSAANETVVGVHLATWHPQPHYNGRNLGLYIRTDSGLTLGGYRNSVRANSFYAGYSMESSLPLHPSLLVGVVSGYPQHKVIPMVVPSVRVGIVRLAAIPMIEKGITSSYRSHGVAWHLSLEKKL